MFSAIDGDRFRFFHCFTISRCWEQCIRDIEVITLCQVDVLMASVTIVLVFCVTDEPRRFRQSTIVNDPLRRIIDCRSVVAYS
jgi:hypothetical protein